MSHPIGIYPKCLEIRTLTKHHCFPRRFFPKQNRPVCIWICRDCHDNIEKKIPYHKKMPKSFYLNVAKDFLAQGATQSVA